MSGEFGSYDSGYFWDQIVRMVDDLEGGSLESTRIWAPVFKAFAPIAHAIAWTEASDSSPPVAILELWKHLPEVKRALAKVEEFAKPYQEVAQRAVELALREQADQQ